MSHSWQTSENVVFISDGDPANSSAKVRVHLTDDKACAFFQNGSVPYWEIEISWTDLAEFVLGRLADLKIEEIEIANTWKDLAKALGLM